MSFDHERLEVYQLSLDFIVSSADVVAKLPRGRRHLVDQLNRASTSIVLNIAEGAGKYSRADKRRYYLSATGSATECAAILDVCRRLGCIDETLQNQGKAILARVVAMLTRLAKNLEQTG